ncbi:hypothetical protein LTR36_002674 [Oleoguttula mirabilis]|uniref:Bromodomain associated domain-containing protein n=1 Tax=Oleoguttula mirabilis TaxID=1507867 RepID=A0AAV9JKE5_9PEZI|nr:hypothetical protein LTR36_002674 [Oleoguttula mirabilis]
MSQAHDLHRALLRPAIIHTLRAAGFHSTKPSVLDTLTNIAERYLLLLASTTAQHAYNTHNEPTPTITDVRLALTDCGVLIPAEGAAEEEWREIMRVPVVDMAKRAGDGKAGEKRMAAEKRKREEEDLKDVTEFTRWVEGGQHAEIRRVAGMVPDQSATGALPAVGVGGGVVQAEDYLTVLKKRHGKGGQDDSRLQGTVLGRDGDDKDVVVEGGPVQRIRDWRPRLEERSANVVQSQQDEVVRLKDTPASASDSGTEPGDALMAEAAAAAEVR